MSVEGPAMCQSCPRPRAETGASLVESSTPSRHNSFSHSPPFWQGSHPQAAPDFDFSIGLPEGNILAHNSGRGLHSSCPR